MFPAPRKREAQVGRKCSSLRGGDRAARVLSKSAQPITPARYAARIRRTPADSSPARAGRVYHPEKHYLRGPGRSAVLLSPRRGIAERYVGGARRCPTTTKSD